MESNGFEDRLEKRLEKLIRRGQLSGKVVSELEQLKLSIRAQMDRLTERLDEDESSEEEKISN